MYDMNIVYYRIKLPYLYLFSLKSSKDFSIDDTWNMHVVLCSQMQTSHHTFFLSVFTPLVTFSTDRIGFTLFRNTMVTLKLKPK